ncbi:hypothetical protein [Fodinicola acaciae]|uniref:hypothetical protein n=1 Tax=Fodinicola acaciae TaxID=2681555 RepID=UPI0013D06218|nr:hypothetical protein [Fodinicola acaciae]
MIEVRQVLSLRRQVVQARLDATRELHTARISADQRRVDHLAGKALAMQMIVDMIDIEFQLNVDEEEYPALGRHRRA